VDRIAREIKAERQWGEKWERLNDPRLYVGESGPAAWPVKAPVSTYHDDVDALFLVRLRSNGEKPAKWSPFSIINPPGRSPAPDDDPSLSLAESGVTGKITGDPTHRRRHRAGRPQQQPPSPPPSAPASPPLTLPPDDPRFPPSSDPHHAASGLSKHQRAPLATYGYALHSARLLRQTRFAPGAMPDPYNVYRIPPTTSMELGWKWGGVASLERYGTSAHYGSSRRN
ncbi:hypothetical protein BDK51DRAFT_37539, partial [Blyttiomyces helicus]